MLRLINVSKKYGTNTVLKNINLHIEKGRFIAFTGTSGSGKTTLLNIMAGFDDDYEGSVLYHRQPLGKSKTVMACMFQQPHLLEHLTVAENIRLPLRYKQGKDNTAEIVNMLGLGKLVNRFPVQLSGGEKQRTVLARALNMRAELLLADEPTGSLDEENAGLIISLFRELCNRGMTVIMVTHDIRLAGKSDKIYKLEQGHVVS